MNTDMVKTFVHRIFLPFKQTLALIPAMNVEQTNEIQEVQQPLSKTVITRI